MVRRKRGGRPRESLDGQVRKQHQIRFTDKEWALVKRLAKRAKLTPSAWVRARAQTAYAYDDDLPAYAYDDDLLC